ncbi:MAG: hypothetical protein WCA28_26965 [Bradyrhizobium sp.]
MMIKTNETGGMCMNAASNVAGPIAYHNPKSMKLSGDSTQRSLEHTAKPADAKTGLEVIGLSGAHCRDQLNIIGCCTGNLIDPVCKMPKGSD